MTYQLCAACVGALPGYSHLASGDTILIVGQDDCPRCGAERVTLTELGREIVAAGRMRVA